MQENIHTHQILVLIELTFTIFYCIFIFSEFIDFLPQKKYNVRENVKFSLNLQDCMTENFDDLVDTKKRSKQSLGLESFDSV